MFAARQIEKAVKDRISLETDYTDFVKGLQKKAQKMRKPSENANVKRESKVPNRFMVVGGYTSMTTPTRRKFTPGENTGDPEWMAKKQKRKLEREEQKLAKECGNKKVKVENETPNDLRQIDGESFAILSGYVIARWVWIQIIMFQLSVLEDFNSVAVSDSDVWTHL